MDLDNLKSAWQEETILLPSAKEKNMSQITKLIEKNVSTTLEKQNKRFMRIVIQLLIVPILLVILFYAMSDGFTNENDSVGGLFVILVLFLPFLLFFGARYRATRSFALTQDSDVHSNLPRTIKFLQQQQRIEVGLLSLLSILAGVGVFLMGQTGNTLGTVPMVLAVSVAIFVTVSTWRNYQIRLNELHGYVAQLRES